MQQVSTTRLRRSALVWLSALACAFQFAIAPGAAADRASVDANAQRVTPGKAFNIGGALSISDDVGYAFLTTQGPVRLDITRIVNESTTRTSGTVRAALFLTREPTPTNVYYIVGSTDLGVLAPGASFGPLSHTVPYAPPPDGTYYVHLGAFEYEPPSCTTSTGYCLDDFVTLQNRVHVVNGQIFDAGPPAPSTTLAVEYFHTGFLHYFVTTFSEEIALLDAGRFGGWVRTGRTFKVYSTNNQGSLSGVCRFFSTSFAPKSSHFYTPFADECATVQANRNWQFEAIAFYVAGTAFNGACPAGTTPLYRLYNNGIGGAPNHRYTVDLGVRSQMIGFGWTPEGYGPLGAIACVPL
ncbi:MAG TPA: hypothetical protein VNG69_03560 [Casimicrobiaceae bacterium]|nr:hypothetical protein [Casimicrobiaceae bacterium]